MINIEVERRLSGAVAVAAFEGWNDAAEAATDAVSHLLTSWRAELLATVDPEDYYDFQVNRPHVGFDADGVREVSWRTTSFWHCTAGPVERDIVLVTGIEPNLRWRSFWQLKLRDLIAAVIIVVSFGAILFSAYKAQELRNKLRGSGAEHRTGGYR